MRIQRDAYNWLIRLERGELLSRALLKAVTLENIKTGWIAGIGACRWVELGFYDLENKEYRWQKFDNPLEILSLQGNVSIGEGKPSLHLHGTFSKPDYQTIGGHVKDLEVAGTCEIFLHDWFADGIMRKTDPDTGLNLLKI